MTTTRNVVALLMCAVLPAGFSRAAEPAAEPSALVFVEALADKPCDETNRAWSVLNKHSYLSVQVTLNWQPVGGMEKQETLVLPPLKRVPVGCAPDVKIVSATLMQF